MAQTLLSDLWDNGLAGAGAVALVLGVWIAAKSVGLLDRPKHWLQSTYLPPMDILGFFTMPHFLVEYENRGNVPVVFSDFELVLPRFEEVSPTGEYVMHLGADLYIDKRKTSRIGGLQHLRKVDYRTSKVRLEPGESHTDFFDLGVLAGEDIDLDEPLEPARLPDNFEPVLTFKDSFGARFHCDAQGIHAGRWVAPMLREFEAADVKLKPETPGLLSKRRLVRWLGWTREAAPALFDLVNPRLPWPRLPRRRES